MNAYICMYVKKNACVCGSLDHIEQLILRKKAYLVQNVGVWSWALHVVDFP